jgi:hypothetical protein
MSTSKPEFTVLSENEQYIPIGYHGDLSSDTKISLNNTTIPVGILTITFGIVMAGLFLHSKKRKRTRPKVL